jgi:hypothetical protein
MSTLPENIPTNTAVALFRTENERLKLALNDAYSQDWTASLIDRLNELVRENTIFFTECHSGPSAADLIRVIHGQFNTLRSDLLAAQAQGAVMREALQEADHALTTIQGAYATDVMPFDEKNMWQIEDKKVLASIRNALSTTLGSDLLERLEKAEKVAADLRWHADAICAMSGHSDNDITKTVADIIAERDRLKADEHKLALLASRAAEILRHLPDHTQYEFDVIGEIDGALAARAQTTGDA